MPKTSLPPPWSLSPAQLLQELDASPDRGLDDEQAEKRLREYGPNTLKDARRGPLMEALLSQLRNPLVWLLSISAVLSGLAGEAKDAAIVLSILGLGSFIAILQESRAGHALALLRERIAQRSRVLRSGTEKDVPTSTVVPGDILVLAAGTLVAADAVILDARDLYLNEAPLTGEPFAAAKFPGVLPAEAPLAEHSNMVYMGTNVRSGTGRALVVATGPATSFGNLAARLASGPVPTEFSKGMRQFGYLLLNIMMVLAFVVFAASAVRRHPPMEALLFAIALAVGLAPEMLPAVLSTMLARGARRMAAGGVLVRRLETIENLGCMNVLCTDKTGTLTEGEIHLEQGLDIGGQPSSRVVALGYWNAVLQTGLPNPLDRALVEAMESGAPALPEKLDELPFDFARKRLSIAVRQADGQPLLLTKGAFASVLSICRYVRAGEQVERLDEAARMELCQQVEAWSLEGLRVLAVATRPLASGSVLDLQTEDDEVLEGFLTFRDPPKAGVAEALADLRSLGVRVKIVSGDHHGVVRHLAGQIGVPAERWATGSDIEGLKEEALWHLVESTDLFAEVDPGQKERILTALQKHGNVVGFMGDGINDSPSIHTADVGISVEGATEVAREAADFVLLRPNLEILRDGIREGRKIFANTTKYVLTTESANLGNMLSMAGAAIFLPFLPLLAHQVLLNNFLSDIPSTTLSADRVDEEVLARPRGWDIVFLRRFMISFGLISAFYDAATFVTLTWVFRAPAATFRTAWFVESLLTELLVLMVLRTRRPFWRSRPHPALTASTILVILVAIGLPLSPLAGALGFVPLRAALWCAVLGIAFAYVLTVELVKRPLLAAIEGA